MLNNNIVHYIWHVTFHSPTVADLSEGLVAISIEDTECNTQKPIHTKGLGSDEVKRDDEQLLPNKLGYEWKEITKEFFEAVKGKHHIPFMIFVLSFSQFFVMKFQSCSWVN